MCLSTSWDPFLDFLSGSFPAGLKRKCPPPPLPHFLARSSFHIHLGLLNLIRMSFCRLYVTFSFSTKDVESMSMNLSPPRRCFASSTAHFSVIPSPLLQWLSTHHCQQRQNTPTSVSKEEFELADTNHNKLQVIKPVGRTVESPSSVITDDNWSFWAVWR